VAARYRGWVTAPPDTTPTPPDCRCASPRACDAPQPGVVNGASGRALHYAVHRSTIGYIGGGGSGRRRRPVPGARSAPRGAPPTPSNSTRPISGTRLGRPGRTMLHDRPLGVVPLSASRPSGPEAGEEAPARSSAGSAERNTIRGHDHRQETRAEAMTSMFVPNWRSWLRIATVSGALLVFANTRAHEQVVPDPQELEDRQCTRSRGSPIGQDDRSEDLELAGAVDAPRLRAALSGSARRSKLAE